MAGGCDSKPGLYCNTCMDGIPYAQPGSALPLLCCYIESDCHKGIPAGGIPCFSMWCSALRSSLFSFPVGDLMSCPVLYLVMQGQALYDFLYCYSVFCDSVIIFSQKKCAFVCTEQGFGTDGIRFGW